MARYKRSYNPRLIKSRRAYSFEEIGEIYKKHIRTVQEWHRAGMKALDDNKRPVLVMGSEVQAFLNRDSPVGTGPPSTECGIEFSWPCGWK